MRQKVKMLAKFDVKNLAKFLSKFSVCNMASIFNSTFARFCCENKILKLHLKLGQKTNSTSYVPIYI